MASVNSDRWPVFGGMAQGTYGTARGLRKPCVVGFLVRLQLRQSLSLLRDSDYRDPLHCKV